MTTDSTVAPRAHAAIDPKMFLDYFTACGGGYCLTPDRQLWLGILQTGTSKENRSIAAQIMREVKPADAERIKAYLEAKEKGESEMADNWSEALVRFRIAERAYADFRPTERPDSEDDMRKGDALANTQHEAEKVLMALPAPDIAALRWKLDRILEDDGTGSISPWDNAWIEQTRRDIARLLMEG